MVVDCTFKGRAAARGNSIIDTRIMEIVADHTDGRTSMMELILLLNRSREDLTRHLDHLEREGLISPSNELRTGGDFFAALLSYDITGEGRRFLDDRFGMDYSFPLEQLPLIHHMI